MFFLYLFNIELNNSKIILKSMKIYSISQFYIIIFHGIHVKIEEFYDSIILEQKLLKSQNLIVTLIQLVF